MKAKVRATSVQTPDNLLLFHRWRLTIRPACRHPQAGRPSSSRLLDRLCRIVISFVQQPGAKSPAGGGLADSRGRGPAFSRGGRAGDPRVLAASQGSAQPPQAGMQQQQLPPRQSTLGNSVGAVRPSFRLNGDAKLGADAEGEASLACRLGYWAGLQGFPAVACNPQGTQFWGENGE
jgi:hypothetical protein